MDKIPEQNEIAGDVKFLKSEFGVHANKNQLII